MNKLIIFLIRKKLDIKEYQLFFFVNQANTNEFYYFTETEVLKRTYLNNRYFDKPSNLKLNFLLSDDCLKYIRRTEKRSNNA